MSARCSWILLALGVGAWLLLATSSGAATPAADALERDAAAAARAGELGEAALLYGEAAQAWLAEGAAAGRFRALLRRGEIERDLGRPRGAVETLQQALAIAESELEAGHVAAALGALGSALLAAGDIEAATRELLRAERLARKADSPLIGAAVINELGRLYEHRDEVEQARVAYARAAAAAAAQNADGSSLAFRALTNRALLADAQADPSGARSEMASARAAGLPLGANRDHAYSWIRLGRGGIALAEQVESDRAGVEAEAEADLGRAEAMAQTTADSGAGTWALGSLAELRRRQGRNAEARELAQEALRIAHRASAPDAELRWLMLLGALEAGAGNGDSAIRHLSRAVELLAERRIARTTGASARFADVMAMAGDTYLTLADQLLLRARHRGNDALATADRRLALDTMEQLHATELRDYFRDDCVDSYRARVKNPAAASEQAAVLYPIALEDRLELLVSSHRGIRQFTVDVSRAELERNIDAYVAHLRIRTTFRFLAPAQQLNAWLVAPARDHLRELGVDTLVFVLSQRLRTAPMAALHDGQSFLIERYALAVTPGLELTDPGPIDRSRPSVFLGGVSEAVQGFPALEHVPAELASVQEVFGGAILLDDEFTTSAVERTLDTREFSVVHIATHGQFGETGDDTFLLTHDGRLSMDALAKSVGAFRYRDKALDLIILSACETAVGDERAALGLAGVAVKSGARSAIGTLWQVNDQATAILINEFYHQLHQPGVTRAAALRSGQRKLLGELRYRHPAYWSPFLLISNWL